AGPPAVTTEERLASGRAALRAGDAVNARRAFEEVLAASPDDVDVMEDLARAAYVELDFAGALDGWTRAYAAHRAASNQLGAVRVARILAYLHGAVMGDEAVMRGWIARAQTLLAETPDSADAGWVSLKRPMI